MPKRSGLLGVLEGLDIIQGDDPPSESETPSSTSPAAPASPTPVAPSAPLSASVDADMVAKIRAVVTASTHAPRLTNFLTNLATAKSALPNDERSAVIMALAFSKLTAHDIRDELTKAVAAAMIEAENKIKGDVSRQRELLATELDTEAERHRGSISSLEEQIKTLQGALGTAQTALSQIDSTRAQKAAAIDGNESTALASLAAVRAELASISNLLP